MKRQILLISTLCAIFLLTQGNAKGQQLDYSDFYRMLEQIENRDLVNEGITLKSHPKAVTKINGEVLKARGQALAKEVDVEEDLVNMTISFTFTGNDMKPNGDLICYVTSEEYVNGGWIEYDMLEDATYDEETNIGHWMIPVQVPSQGACVVINPGRYRARYGECILAKDVISPEEGGVIEINASDANRRFTFSFVDEDGTPLRLTTRVFDEDMNLIDEVEGNAQDQLFYRWVSCYGHPIVDILSLSDVGIDFPEYKYMTKADIWTNYVGENLTVGYISRIEYQDWEKSLEGYGSATFAEGDMTFVNKGYFEYGTNNLIEPTSEFEDEPKYFLAVNSYVNQKMDFGLDSWMHSSDGVMFTEFPNLLEGQTFGIQNGTLQMIYDDEAYGIKTPVYFPNQDSYFIPVIPYQINTQSWWTQVSTKKQDMLFGSEPSIICSSLSVYPWWKDPNILFPKFSVSGKGYYGDLREQYTVNSNYSVTADSETICQDTDRDEMNSALQNWLKNGSVPSTVSIIVSNTEQAIEGLQMNRCVENIINWEAGEYDMPTLLAFTPRDSDGSLSYNITADSNSSLIIAAASLCEIYGEEFYENVIKEAHLEAEWTVHGSDIWTPLPLEILNEYEEGCGSVYQADLMVFADLSESSWIDLRLTSSNDSGNKQIQTLSPALKITTSSGLVPTQCQTTSYEIYYNFMGQRTDKPLKGLILRQNPDGSVDKVINK